MSNNDEQFKEWLKENGENVKELLQTYDNWLEYHGKLLTSDKKRTKFLQDEYDISENATINIDLGNSTII